MAWVTSKLEKIWESGLFVGEDTPTAVVQVQLGHWVRGWYRQDEVAYPKVGAKIWGEGNYPEAGATDGHWSPKWVATTPWYDVPNLVSIKRNRAFEQNGVAVLEVVVDAQDYVAKTGPDGDPYHVIRPGWLTPTRNYVAPGRPDPKWDLAPWAPDGKAGRLFDGACIRVWQGYGPPEDGAGGTPPRDGGSNGAWTFRGLIDDVDIDGNPNSITITARNGKLLTDQRTFRGAKSVQIKDPITFYDSKAAKAPELVGSGAFGSSQDPAHKASNVLDVPHDPYNANSHAYDTYWEGAGIYDPERPQFEYVEIRLPPGRFEHFWVNAPAGQTAYVGVKAKAIVRWTAPTRDPSDDPDRGFTTTQLVPEQDPPTEDGGDRAEGWVDHGPKTPRESPNGGWPYIKTFTTSGRPQKVELGHTFELGNHSILRLGFKSLTPKVRDLHALRYKRDKDVVKEQFILVDDASDVTRVVLRWAGFQEWDVEQAGVRLSNGTNYGPGVVGEASGRLVFNRQTHLIDIIQGIGKQLGFIFYIADPKDGDSWGVPTFRRDSSLMSDPSYLVAHCNEKTMLTGVKVKHSDENRASIIRVRGKTAAADAGGVPLGGDLIRRVMATYLPPWTPGGPLGGDMGSRNAGVIRHVVYQDDQLINYAMCLYGCLLIAMNAAVAMHTATIEIPANPIIELDDHVGITDEATGTNSRMWVISSEDTMILGKSASWKQTLQGSLIDSDDLRDVIRQSKGLEPIQLGLQGATDPPFFVTVDSINWRHVVDPDTGEASGYRSVAENVARNARKR